MIWTLPLTNLQCPCLELISNELSGWIFCCVRRAISHPFPTVLKTRDAFQVWPVHVTGYIPHSLYSFTLEIPEAFPALGRRTRSGSSSAQHCCVGLDSRCHTAKHSQKQALQKTFEEERWERQESVPRPATGSQKQAVALLQPSLPWLWQQDNRTTLSPQVCQAL